MAEGGTSESVLMEAVTLCNNCGRNIPMAEKGAISTQAVGLPWLGDMEIASEERMQRWFEYLSKSTVLHFNTSLWPFNASFSRVWAHTFYYRISFFYKPPLVGHVVRYG